MKCLYPGLAPLDLRAFPVTITRICDCERWTLSVLVVMEVLLMGNNYLASIACSYWIKVSSLHQGYEIGSDAIASPERINPMH